MQDINGVNIAVGDTITCDVGDVKVIEHIGDNNSSNHGALVSVLTSDGQKVSLRLLLSNAKLKVSKSSLKMRGVKESVR